MAELSIPIEYKDRVKESTSTWMRHLFPLWAIILPLFFIFLAMRVFVILGSSDLPPVYIFAFCFTPLFLAGILIPLNLMLLLRSLQNSNLLLDKQGIQLPSDLSKLKSKRYLPWKDVTRIWAVVPEDLSRAEIVISAQKEERIKVGRLKKDDLEQLLVTINLLSPVPIDSSLDELNLTLKQAKSEDPLLLNYTAMWEDELSRRFRPAAFMPLQTGVVVRNGTLTIVRQLAIGGLSAVYLGKLTNKLVVLKESVVPEDAASELKEKAQEMFARQARLLMELDHPAITRVLDYFVESGRTYLMLDYINGQDLRQYVKQHGVVRESLVLDWALQMCEILIYLHEHDPPIVHRDFTPDNLVLSDGKLVAIDFGAANEFIGQATGTFVGKHSFIAPEQFRGKATPQSDIYALGSTLFYLLTAVDPQALSQSDPKELSETVSIEMANLVKHCTALELESRITDASELKRQIMAIKEKRGVSP